MSSTQVFLKEFVLSLKPYIRMHFMYTTAYTHLSDSFGTFGCLVGFGVVVVLFNHSRGPYTFFQR
jgi:hypothetical protein